MPSFSFPEEYDKILYANKTLAIEKIKNNIVVSIIFICPFQKTINSNKII
jgi:hypothetical protein